MNNWNIEKVRSYLKSYQIENTLFGLYVYYSERQIKVEFVENDNRGQDKITQSSILSIIDKLPPETMTNVLDITNGRMKLSNDLLLAELNYVEDDFEFEIDFEDSQSEFEQVSFDLVKKFENFDNVYYRKIDIKKDFCQRYKLKNLSLLEYEIKLIENSNRPSNIINFKKGENNERKV